MSYSQQIKNKISSSVSIKLLVIGFLLLLLQIPMSYVRSLIYERQSMQTEAKHEIGDRWGGEQHIGAPLLNVKHTKTEIIDKKAITNHYNSQILPATFNLQVDLAATKRYLGIYEVPVFVATISMHGEIEINPLLHLGQENNWSIQNLFIPIKEMRGLRKIDKLLINNQEVKLSQQQGLVNGMTGITIEVKDFPLAKKLSYTIDMVLAGSRQFDVMPMAGQSTVNIKSNWDSPSFMGEFLPEKREITNDGFIANWQVNELNHNLGRVIRQNKHRDNFIVNNSWPVFGVQILIPANTYQVNERTVKYSLLIMVLTFAGFFLAEMFFRLQIHSFQYVLIGFSLSVFYLLLLSISEYIRFQWAFLISALAIILLIGGYCCVVLKQRKRGIYTGLLFALLYGFIFVLVKAQQFSLLMGAIGIWLFLGVVMYLTRKIDWYNVNSSENEKTVDGD